MNLNFDIGVLAQKCLKLCVNGVLKFQFFFINLSSKFLPGVRVRMSEYPSMDICVDDKIYENINICVFTKKTLSENRVILNYT